MTTKMEKKPSIKLTREEIEEEQDKDSSSREEWEKDHNTTEDARGPRYYPKVNPLERESC